MADAALETFPMALWQGDCLQVLPCVADASADMVFADLPYGVTANKWDSVIPFEPLWAELLRVGKSNAAFVFTATFDFAVALRNSQPGLSCYDIVWHKGRPTGAMNAKRRPMRVHELCLVFYRAQPSYNPQKTPGKRTSTTAYKYTSKTYGVTGRDMPARISTERYPTSVLSVPEPDLRRDTLNGNKPQLCHPTQKPVALLEWLIKTYSNPGDVVLDPAMGSGTTGVACVNTGRNFVGIEKDPAYFALARGRIEDATKPPGLPFQPTLL